jgi:hypothetical protein
MKAGTVAVGAVLVAIAFSGCGSSSTPSSATTAKATTARSGTGSAATTLPPGTPAALRGAHGSVLRADELPGFVPQGPLTLSTSAQSAVAEAPPDQRASEAASLKALGFVAGLNEKLAPSKGGVANEGGVSLVELFRSSHGASGEVASQLKQALKRGESTFAVPGIPGARGFGFSGSSTNANVAFAVGPYYYLIGFSAPSASAPTRAQLIAAAQSLYRRVRA